MITDIQRGEMLATARCVLLLHTQLRRTNAMADGMTLLTHAQTSLLNELDRLIGNMTQLRDTNAMGDGVRLAATIVIAMGGDIDPKDL